MIGTNQTKLLEIIKSKSLAKTFDELNINNGNIVWSKEYMFASQQLQKSTFTMSAAIGNPASVRAAILNIAAIGISLNPALAHAYLVPRGGVICLDISYRGLIKKATDSGSIKWAKADVVYEKDTFEWNGVCEKPTHTGDIFGDRGAMVGAYCIAKLYDGSFLVECLSMDDINKIKSKSKAKSNDVPWVVWFVEMAKKAAIKRAAKTWPQMENQDALDEAIHMLNKNEGIVIEGNSEVVKEVKTSGIAALRDSLIPKEEAKVEENSENPNMADNSVVSEIGNYYLISDEIESAENEGGLAACVEKITGCKDLTKDEKNKLRTAYKDKQKEIESGRDS